MVIAFQIILIVALVIALMGAVAGEKEQQGPMLGLALASMAAFLVSLWML